jgi:hypothetical protein
MLTRVEQQKAACSIGAFCLAWLEAHLAYKSSLLISQALFLFWATIAKSTNEVNT